MPPSRVEAIIDRWQARGRYWFSRQDLAGELGKWDNATRDALRRLAASGRVGRPRIGFYVIVPLEYRSAGAPPASWFIDPLMDHLGQPYYVGLLSAAELHGAAHQRPQELQVVTDRPTRPVEVGRVRIRFTVNSSLRAVAVQEVKTATGFMRVSTPAATALDLVRYQHASGGYDHVAGLLAELADAIDPEELARAADAVPSVVARRTGYLLEQVGHLEVAEGLRRRLSREDSDPQPLEAGAPTRGAERDDRWHLYVNRAVEPEVS